MGAMKSKYKAAVAIMAVALLGMALWHWCGQPQPLSGVKPRRDWEKILCAHGIDQTAYWKGIGPQAIPYLAASLNRRNSIANRAYLRLWPRLPRAFRTRLPMPVDAFEVDRNACDALLGFPEDESVAFPWAKTDPAVVPQFIYALKNEDKQIRSMAALMLQNAGIVHPQFKEEIVSQLAERLQRDSDRWVRFNAAVALGFQGEAARAAVPQLLAALNDTDKYVRHNAVDTLMLITPDASNKAGAEAAMLPALVQMLRDSDPRLRRSGAEVLAKLGKVAQPAVPALLAVLDDPDPATRKLAAKALKAIDIEAAAKAGVK